MRVDARYSSRWNVPFRIDLIAPIFPASCVHQKVTTEKLSFILLYQAWPNPRGPREMGERSGQHKSTSGNSS